MTLRDGILTVKNNGFLNLDIEGDFKIVVDSYNRKIIIPVSIILQIVYISNMHGQASLVYIDNVNSFEDTLLLSWT